MKIPNILLPAGDLILNLNQVIISQIYKYYQKISSLNYSIYITRPEYTCLVKILY
jgi:hypothetical protein